ncbi:molybdopterin-dependent oxidoreductase [Desulforudis sp. DRI-14]|uniref:molybdopterin-dependent oxidoreductase n=1 Tax=Desulforudis sp. DRI-14 TaxID=3459793 RepID=UPI004041888D
MKETGPFALTIDGRETTVAPGTTIIEAAAGLGIDIPHLCYCPGLKSTGSCRLCIVEIEGLRSPVVACKREATPGIVVHTDSPTIREARRFVVELLLSRHPRECLTCDKNGVCQLQRYAYELGAQADRFPVELPNHPVDDHNPFIFRDPNYCVLCGRCIRICYLQGAGIIDFINRGLKTKVGTPWDRPLDQSGCDFCGSCVEVCPTAALIERQRRGRGREWELRRSVSVCGHCGAACAVNFHLKGGEIVKVGAPQQVDYLCGRGRFGWAHLSHPERLTAPLVKKNGTLVAVNWAEALDAAANGLRAVREQWGPDSVAGIIGTGVSNEVAHAFQSLMRIGLRTNNLGISPGLKGPADVLHDLDTVYGGKRATLEDIASADVLLVIGDTVRRSPVVWAKVKRALANGANLIYVGFYNGRLAKTASVWLRSRPEATEAVLHQMAAMLLRLDESGRLPGRRLEGFSDYKTALQRAFSMTISDGEGLEAKDLAAACAAFGDLSRKAVVIFAADGVSRGTAAAAVNLALLTGRTERAIYPVVSGANATGILTLLKIGKTSTEAAMNAVKMLTGTNVRGLYILAEDPLSFFPDPERWRGLINELEFLVVQDMFLTPTAALADVVLPASSHVEEDGSFINAAGHPVRFDQAVPPVGMGNLNTLAQIAARLGSQALGGEAHGPTAEIERLVSGRAVPGTSKPALFLPSVSNFTKGNTPGISLVGYASRFYPVHDTRLRFSGFARLEPYGGDCIALSPIDAGALGIAEGADVVVQSPYSKASARVKIDNGLLPGVALVSPDAPVALAILGGSWPLGPVPIQLTVART